MAAITIKEIDPPMFVNLFTDSQAAIQALAQPWVTKPSIRECKEALNSLHPQCKITLKWIKAHNGYAGNEYADYLAKKGTGLDHDDDIPLPLAPKPFFKGLLKDELREKWDERWQGRPDCRQTKHWFPSVDFHRSTDLVSRDRERLGLLTQFFTGHNSLMYHESNIDEQVDDTCRLCLEDVETVQHLVCECPAICLPRRNIFGGNFVREIPSWTLLEVERFLAEPTILPLFRRVNVD